MTDPEMFGDFKELDPGERERVENALILIKDFGEIEAVLACTWDPAEHDYALKQLSKAVQKELAPPKERDSGDE
mgnify:CR=1 FL=1|tara:strand:- start:1137 stop:1358 length:222 start_codon:yes stop_codon:yes gene_type:complete